MGGGPVCGSRESTVCAIRAPAGTVALLLPGAPSVSHCVKFQKITKEFNVELRNDFPRAK